jgi:RES domain-containing protein
VPTVWRIVKAVYATQAFDGEGARIYGGRWNSPSVRMVYTADSAALAALEHLVRLNDASAQPKFVLISAVLPDELVDDLDRSALPEHWRSTPAPPALQQIGDRWAKSKGSAALRVPSAIIEQQSNYLLNPEHPAFSSIAIGAVERFIFDERLLRRP